jgi:hypothetical protein
MNCKICTTRMDAPYAVAVKINSRELSIKRYNRTAQPVKGSVLLCGVRCSGSALERFLQSGSLEMPNQQGRIPDNGRL